MKWSLTKAVYNVFIFFYKYPPLTYDKHRVQDIQLLKWNIEVALLFMVDHQLHENDVMSTSSVFENFLVMHPTEILSHEQCSWKAKNSTKHTNNDNSGWVDNSKYCTWWISAILKKASLPTMFSIHVRQIWVQHLLLNKFGYVLHQCHPKIDFQIISC